ncbi:hypothetical protein SBA4_570007 [Candidatus Sulfopaludibacter sp. SbA4]|nr:hypothetical protein SBA4_570007 [Candidatus Sulfopaludibacter sp. SbA4]
MVRPGHRAGGRGSDWDKNFDLKKAPKIWQAAQGSGHRRGEATPKPVETGLRLRSSAGGVRPL